MPSILLSAHLFDDMRDGNYVAIYSLKKADKLSSLR